MKVGVIADLHGKNVWKEFVKERSDIQHWIFTGDFVDSFDKTNEEIITNLKELIEYKKANMDKVTLLLGNHDVPYFYLNEIVHHKAKIPYNSGTDFEIGWDLHGIFYQNRELFKLAHQIGNNLFTHAGVSEEWYKAYEKIIMDYWKTDLKMSFADVLNGLSKTSNRAILFRVGDARGGSGHGGIVWSCQEETKWGILKGFHQFVGHTRQKSINTITFDKETSITYLDVLSVKPEYLELDIKTK